MHKNSVASWPLPEEIYSMNAAGGVSMVSLPNPDNVKRFHMLKRIKWDVVHYPYGTNLGMVEVKDPTRTFRISLNMPVEYNDKDSGSAWDPNDNVLFITTCCLNGPTVGAHLKLQYKFRYHYNDI